MARGAALTEAALAHALDAVRGAVLAAFPGGLPPWDPVRRGLEGAAQGQVRPSSLLLGDLQAAASKRSVCSLWLHVRQFSSKQFRLHVSFTCINTYSHSHTCIFYLRTHIHINTCIVAVAIGKCQTASSRRQKATTDYNSTTPKNA